MEDQYILLRQYPFWCFWWSEPTIPKLRPETMLMPAKLLAYALANMTGVGGYDGWRWIFIIEGLVTVVVAAVAKFFVVDWPETSKFLNDDDRRLLLRRLRDDVAEARMDRMDKKATRRVFSDWKIYVGYVSIYYISLKAISM